MSTCPMVQQVAVKRFRPEVLSDDACVRLLCNEIEIMTSLKNRYVSVPC